MIREDLVAAVRRYAYLAVIVLGCLPQFCSAQTERILANFIAFPEGSLPNGDLIADSHGNLYGVTLLGGRYGNGTVFKLARGQRGRWMHTTLYNFQGGNDGSAPTGRLILDSSGNIYGATAEGGFWGGQCLNFAGCGTIFELSPSANGSWNKRILYEFDREDDGYRPNGNLVFDPAGSLYGTTMGGGASGSGTVFELSANSGGYWSKKGLYNFSGAMDGGNPVAGVIFDSAGNLYGTTQYGGNSNCNPNRNNETCGVVFELTPQNGSWTETVIHTFAYTDGANPEGNLTFDSVGNLFGTTAGGGNSQNGYGTVFRLHPRPNGGWSETVIYNFQDGSDGAFPLAGVTISHSGALYGTTPQGGGPACSEWGSCRPDCRFGCGTVFELVRDSKGQWAEEVIHRFGTGGAEPNSGVLLDANGNIYGAAEYGGAFGGECGQELSGCGTLFKLSRKSGHRWGFDLLYAFPPGREGISPSAGLVADNEGYVYGVTRNGGWNTCVASSGSGCGTVFKVSLGTGGHYDTSVLHNFNGADGADPLSSLIRDSAGNFYGTTISGGSPPDCIDYYAACGGTVYELSPTKDGWKETVLHKFHLDKTDGRSPIAGLVTDASGNFYGATVLGGALDACHDGCGTVFSLVPAGNGKWKEQQLHVFGRSDYGSADGSFPEGTLILDGAGALYGTTCSGGEGGYGTVFKLTPGSGGKWREDILYSFQGPSKGDGDCPAAGVVMDGDGNLFGTTVWGGEQGCGGTCGIVFELSQNGPQWKETVLHVFQQSDGGLPEGALTLDESGNLYGTTYQGGSRSCGGFGCGVLFELSHGPAVWTEQILHTFGTGRDGEHPNGQVVLDEAGNLYGTTANGGVDGSSGTVFVFSLGDFESLCTTPSFR